MNKTLTPRSKNIRIRKKQIKPFMIKIFSNSLNTWFHDLYDNSGRVLKSDGGPRDLLMTSAEVLSPNGQSAYANDLKILTSYLINTLLKINEN